MLTKDHLPERIVTERTIVRRALPGDLPQIVVIRGSVSDFQQRIDALEAGNVR